MPTFSSWYLLLLWMAAGATLVLSVPWGLFVRQRFTAGDSASRRRLLLPQVVLLAGGILILTTPWSFSGVLLDALCLFAAYLAYSGLVFLLSLLHPRKLTWLLTALGMVPTAVGLLSFVGVALVPRESVPHREAWLNPNYSYRVLTPGGASLAHEAELTILYHPTLLPFMEKRVFRKKYQKTLYDFAGLDLQLSPDRRNIVIACPRRGQRDIEQTMLQAD